MAVKCRFCGKVFSSQSNHNRHINEVHDQATDEPISYGKETVWSSRCLEPNCNGSFSNNKNLMQHLHKDHSMKFKTESYSFENMNDFENWKAEIEETNGCYVLKSKYASTIGEVLYYKCNRSKTSYKIKEMDQRSRLLKSQGSCKMNISCTSEIKVTEQRTKITVEWQKVHYGHDFQIQHVRLPKVVKQSIVTKMVNGVTNQRILHTARDQIGDHLKSIDLLTSRDLRNIANSCSLELRNGKRDPNDALSVALWVEESKKLEQNPILFYKNQGTEHHILKKDESTNRKIDSIKALASKFECLDFQKFDDETINKIHYHLMVARNLTNCPKFSNIHSKFQIRDLSKKRMIEPPMRFTSTKKKCVKPNTSLKRATFQETSNIGQNLIHGCEDPCLYRSVDPLNDHQYC